MIVPGLTPNEIVANVRNDLDSMKGQIVHLSQKFGKLVLSTRYRTYPFVKIYDVVSPGKNKFFIAFQAMKRSDWKNPGKMIAGTYLDNDGQYGFILCPSLILEECMIAIITPHFLKRYRERTVGDSGQDTSSLIREFMMRNRMMYMTELNERHSNRKEKYAKEGTRQLAVIVNDGYCIAEKRDEDKKSFFMKTFITEEMMSRSQHEEISKNKELAQSRLRLLELLGGLKKTQKEIFIKN